MENKKCLKPPTSYTVDRIIPLYPDDIYIYIYIESPLKKHITRWMLKLPTFVNSLTFNHFETFLTVTVHI